MWPLLYPSTSVSGREHRSTLFRKIKAWKKRGVLLGKRHVKIVEKT